MSAKAQLYHDGRALVVRVPLRVRKRGCRRLMIAPDGNTATRPKARIDDTILKALGRAYRWKRLLESGEFASIGELAATEKINHSYVRRILRLTLLSPDITELILDGRLPKHLHLEDLLKISTVEWLDAATRHGQV